MSMINGSDNLPPGVVRMIRAGLSWIPPVRAWIRKKSQRNAAQALESYLAGDLALAESNYLGALLWQPDDADLHSSLGQVHYEQSKPGDAEKAFREALDNDYLNLRALKGLGVVLQERGEFRESMYLYLKYLQVKPKDAAVSHNLGAAFHNMGQLEKALTYYTIAEKEEPDDPLFRKNHALALLSLGRFQEARATLMHAREVSPNDAEVDLLLGSAFDGLGETALAMESYESCFTKDPDCAEAHLQFAVAANTIDRYEDSAAHAKTAAKLFRESGEIDDAADSCWELGWSYCKLRDWEASLQASTEALQLNPALTAVHFNLGLVLLQLGRVPEARARYEDGLTRLVQVADLKNHAIDDLDDAIVENPQLDGAQQILEMLQEKYADLSGDLARSAQEPPA